jgi:hypothetical protein
MHRRHVELKSAPYAAGVNALELRSVEKTFPEWSAEPQILGCARDHKVEGNAFLCIASWTSEQKIVIPNRGTMDMRANPR